MVNYANKQFEECIPVGNLKTFSYRVQCQKYGHCQKKLYDSFKDLLKDKKKTNEQKVFKNL